MFDQTIAPSFSDRERPSTSLGASSLRPGTGGGYGDPEDRPKEKILDDLKNGYITREQARKFYHIEWI